MSDTRDVIVNVEPAVDGLIGMLEEMAEHRYGERVSMLDHSLQTAALAVQADASESLVAAALLHDIGHLVGDPGPWGDVDHAALGASFLADFVGSEVVEPIRLHVEAKRWLVSAEATYRDQLSEASIMSLAEQGGPLTQSEATAFMATPGAADAVRLRRWDDSGKESGFESPPVNSWRPMLHALLTEQASSLSPTWARDACRCPECRRATNGQHLLDAPDLLGWTVVAVQVSLEELTVDLANTDDTVHRAVIPVGGRRQDARGPIRIWDRDYGSVLAERAAPASASLNQFLEDLSERGLALAREVPCRPGQVLEFAHRIGHVRETNYGALFDVVTTPDPINLAYTAKGLPLHTDNPYRDPCPSVQLLHCLRSAEQGGASQLSDGFGAAERLRSEHPEDFEVLAATPIRFRFREDGVDLQAVRPLIEVGVDGEVRAVSINHRSMEPPARNDALDVEGFYRAYGRFCSLLADPAAVIDLTLEPGDLIAFDNRRVLHGRSTFPVNGDRHLQGCYIDMDAVRSAVRISRPA